MKVVSHRYCWSPQKNALLPSAWSETKRGIDYPLWLSLVNSPGKGQTTLSKNIDKGQISESQWHFRFYEFDWKYECQIMKDSFTAMKSFSFFLYKILER